MAQKIVAIFGDEFFPKLGAGADSKKRRLSSDNILQFFKSIDPDLVYIIPTAGTCVYSALLCKVLEIPYILVSPYPGFFDTLNKTDREGVHLAASYAKTVILINETLDKSRLEAWDEAVAFLTDAADAIAFLISKGTSKKYNSFMDDYTDKYFESKIVMELEYDGEFIFE